MQRRDLLKSTVPAALAAMLPPRMHTQPDTTAPNGRTFWVEHMHRVAHPVLDALANQRLKATMPVEAAPGQQGSRRHTTYLEAFGRTLSGIAPWLEHGPEAGEEGALRKKYIAMSHAALAAGVDPASPDSLEFGGNSQTLVDAAFLALGMLRAPSVLCSALDARVRLQLAEALRATRIVLAPLSNWLLFAAAVEAALCLLGEPWDKSRVDYALREHGAWYLGDGVYGDGPRFHFDYYNSFVIHPFLLAVLDAVGGHEAAWKAMVPEEAARAARYAHIQERMIAPDGTYPIVGRSITYRCGAFHALADVALRRTLPTDIPPPQVRCALAAVIAQTIGAPGTFDPNGWLQIGVAGHQPSLGENYISTGSLYLCLDAFLPLGLAAEDDFWSAPDALWTAQKVWRGEDLPADHAISG
jgi:hypothetical protein